MTDVSVLVVGSHERSTGGISRFIRNQLRYLPDDVRADVYDIGSPEGDGPVWFVRSLLAALIDALRFPFQESPDVLHVHTSHSFSFFRTSFYVLFGAYVWDCRTILHIHGSSFDEFADTDSPLLSAYQGVVFGATDRLIVLGDYWFEELSASVESDKLRIIPNGVDSDEYDPSFDASPPRIVFISDLVERKGVRELTAAIDSLHATTDARFEVDLAGKGPLAAEFRRLAASHDTVTYHGFVSEETKRALLEDGLVYVLPSHAEGLPFAMLEGMAGGNAIVSTTVGSIPEVITSEHGELVEPGDVDELEAALRSMLESPDETRQLAKNNHDLVRSEYAWRDVIAELVDCYREQVEAAD